MLAILSDIAKYRCLYTKGAVAFQTPGVFDLPGVGGKFPVPQNILDVPEKNYTDLVGPTI